jgi:hypothetical protein
MVVMRGLHVIDGGGATYGPAEMKVITSAFDEAWSEIAGNYGRDGLSARTQLADAILSAAKYYRGDVATLKAAGLRAMRLRH